MKKTILIIIIALSVLFEARAQLGGADRSMGFRVYKPLAFTGLSGFETSDVAQLWEGAFTFELYNILFEETLHMEAFAGTGIVRRKKEHPFGAEPTEFGGEMIPYAGLRASMRFTGEIPLGVYFGGGFEAGVNLGSHDKIKINRLYLNPLRLEFGHTWASGKTKRIYDCGIMASPFSIVAVSEEGFFSDDTRSPIRINQLTGFYFGMSFLNSDPYKKLERYRNR